MTASIGLLTDEIINSLDHEKALKDKLQEKQLEYILCLLLENGFTLSELFTFNNKETIQKILQQQIDHNNSINVTIKSQDKHEFSNIVMDVIQSKIQTQQNDRINTFCYNTFTTHKMATIDPPSNFTYNTSYKSQTPPKNPQSTHPHQPIIDHYQPPPVTPPMTHNNGNTSIPDQENTLDLHFDIDDDLLSINTFGSMPLSQADMGNLSGTNTPNTATINHINNINKSHPSIDELVNTASQPTDDGTGNENNNNLAKTFAEKMQSAIASKTNNSHTPPSVKSYEKTPKKKITTLPQQTNIHPAIVTTQQPQQPYDEYDYYDNEEDTGVPNVLGDMQAPQITLTDDNNQPQQPQSYNRNGYDTNKTDPPPTPRAWEFNWESSPRGQIQSGTPARSPPRIRDPMLIKNALEGVAYYADKLDSLHSEYRRVYSEKQQLEQRLSTLQQEYKSTTMDMIEYQHRYKLIEQSYYSVQCTLQSLIIGIYENFTKMKQQLMTKYEFALDHNRRSQFDRFQQYYDQFANTQQQLLQFGQQQWKLKEKQRLQQQAQQQQQQAQYAANYKVPPTPHQYRDIVNKQYRNDDYKQPYAYRTHVQHLQSLTPRENSRPNNTVTYPWNNNTQQYPSHPQQYNNQQNNINGKNHSYSTGGINQSYNKTFKWGNKQQTNNNQYNTGGYGNGNNQQHAQTPRGDKSSNKKQTSGDIPNMGYVYIGSRMSQLISQIQLSDGEVSNNESRILAFIKEILNKNENFNGFDVVTYGSAQHKLFIKDYSDFDFCIRCKKLGMDHTESIKYIYNKLSENTELSNIDIIDSINGSIHGHYLNNISHIKFFDKISKCSVDLVLNNLPEIGSSRFIEAYESIDPRFALLCRVVKYWCRQRKINDPLSGTLSTYALVLMVINFLQLRRVLPTLSIMVNNRQTGLSPWSTQDDYQINVQKYRDFASKNEEPHSKLLVNFFYFYSHKFNFAKDVVSVRTGTYLTKSEKKWWNVDNDKHSCCVENPFNSKTNLTENVDKKSLKRINDEFHRAYAILCESYKIYEVCKLAE